jgi:predicted anti-sigma-YlaC factor YlaD
MRAWISAELDGELFEFESILLRAHLAGCDSCRTFKHDAAAFTGELRDAPLESMSQPVLVSRRSRLAFRPLRVPGVAALAVLMIASGGLFTSLHSGAIFPDTKTGSVGVLDEGDVYQIRRMKPVRALAQLRLRRKTMAAAAQIPRKTGFQNP